MPTPLEPRRHKPKHDIRAIETFGLLLIAAVILALTLIRYWHNINWSAR
ncbi:MAG TPA: hypothetical protein VFA89_11675 [Terriglobales bacterium]|nr:hypothetical protein [Terriglobales bacterium]